MYLYVLYHIYLILQVLFGAEVENSESGVALDDISVLPGNCNGGKTMSHVLYVRYHALSSGDIKDQEYTTCS